MDTVEVDEETCIRCEGCFEVCEHELPVLRLAGKRRRRYQD